MRSAATTLLTLLATCGSACEVPPPWQYTPPDELISRTKIIALAKVVKVEPSPDKQYATYTFETIQRIKGNAEEHFQITGFPEVEFHQRDVFHDHMDEFFWKNYGGRTPNESDCEIHPQFTAGFTYLVFLNQPHVKSYELLNMGHKKAGVKDKWLQYVVAKVGPNHSLKADPADAGRP